MRWQPLAFVTLSLALSAQAAPRGGTVTGKVVVRNKDKSGSTTFVYVYLERVPRDRNKPEPTAKPEISQRDRKFHPLVQVVPVGTVIGFPNDEPSNDPKKTVHNVFSPDDPVFDLGRYGPNNRNWHQFMDPGEFNIYCDIHPQMHATVKVVPSDKEWIAEVKDGAYAIPNVPAGKYKVHAWRPDSEESVESIVVRDNGTVEVPELHLQEKQSVSVHKRKDGTAYPFYP